MYNAQGGKKTGKYSRPRRMSQEGSDKPSLFTLATKIEEWLDDIVNVPFQGENTS